MISIFTLLVRRKFQSTLPHGERPFQATKKLLEESISIHAPAWGATRAFRYCWCYNEISIHAPAWGATASIGIIQVRRMYFNPRSRMGSDGERFKNLYDYAISIHAPAWGATKTTRAGIRAIQFQSTLPHGERPANAFALSPTCLFQSTLPHGERQQLLPRLIQLANISIHAPAWGATTERRWICSMRNISIHAPAWGATQSILHLSLIDQFQSTLPHGERLRPHGR